MVVYLSLEQCWVSGVVADRVSIAWQGWRCSAWFVKDREWAFCVLDRAAAVLNDLDGHCCFDEDRSRWFSSTTTNDDLDVMTTDTLAVTHLHTPIIELILRITRAMCNSRNRWSWMSRVNMKRKERSAHVQRHTNGIAHSIETLNYIQETTFDTLRRKLDWCGLQCDICAVESCSPKRFLGRSRSSSCFVSATRSSSVSPKFFAVGEERMTEFWSSSFFWCEIYWCDQVSVPVVWLEHLPFSIESVRLHSDSCSGGRSTSPTRWWIAKGVPRVHRYRAVDVPLVDSARSCRVEHKDTG